jgi:hypothetical protein
LAAKNCRRDHTICRVVGSTKSNSDVIEAVKVHAGRDQMNASDEEIEAKLFDFAATHFRTFGKAILIGLMTFSAVAIITGSGWKAFVIGFICFACSCFNTWRRFLEPAAFFVFCAATVYWCDQDFIQHAKTPLAAFSPAG